MGTVAASDTVAYTFRFMSFIWTTTSIPNDHTMRIRGVESQNASITTISANRPS